MTKIDQSRILILATHGFERSELEVPLSKLRGAGAHVEVASPQQGEIRSWDERDWGPSTKVDKAASDIRADDYDALVLPGGQINPDLLRVDEDAMTVVRDFINGGKVVAAICHGPWLLVEADVLDGVRATSYHSIRTDLENAGAEWVDEEVVCEKGIITSRSPDDLEAFVGKIIEEIEEGEHHRRVAAE
jgi:protease I